MLTPLPQYFTEVVEASELLDARGRSDHDPDELGEEERQRKLKRKLNEVCAAESWSGQR